MMMLPIIPWEKPCLMPLVHCNLPRRHKKTLFISPYTFRVLTVYLVYFCHKFYSTTQAQTEIDSKNENIQTKNDRFLKRSKIMHHESLVGAVVCSIMHRYTPVCVCALVFSCNITKKMLCYSDICGHAGIHLNRNITPCNYLNIQGLTPFGQLVAKTKR